MKLHGAVGGVLFCILAGALGAAGCSSTSSGGSGGGGSGEPIPANCNADSSLDCSGGGTGITCDSGTTPDESNGVCSDPSPQSDGTDGFCCIAFADPGCAQDDTVTGCDDTSYGFSCASGSADPSADDSTLVCSTPVTDPTTGNDDYCCADSGGGGGTGSCDADSSLSCDAGATGLSCTGGATPGASDGICSDPSPQSDGSDGYCCVDQTFTDCTQDDSVTGGCAYPSFGFSCSGGSPDPSTDDPTLNCSSPTTDPNTGDDLYCCQ